MFTAFAFLLEFLHQIHPSSLLKEFLTKKNFHQKIPKWGKFFVFSLGKAGFSMADAFMKYLEDISLKHLFLGGFAVVPYGEGGNIEGWEIIESAHPYPDKNSLKAGKRLLEIARSLDTSLSVVVLLSGGASSLVEYPIEGITLEDIQEITKRLLSSSLPIQKVNQVRKALSLIKGGGLGEVLFPRKVYLFLLSDVIDKKPIRHVSSSPLYPERIPRKSLEKLFQKYELPLNLLPSKIPVKRRSSLKKTYLIGDNHKALQIAKTIFQKMEIPAHIFRHSLTYPIEKVERILFKDICSLKKKEKPRVAIWGGEPYLEVKGKGKGGRNQELALRIALKMAQEKDFPKNFFFLSFATDGIDGPTDSAGGFIQKESIELIRKDLTFYQEALQENNSYYALEKLSAHIKTGYTGSNLNDIMIFGINVF